VTTTPQRLGIGEINYTALSSSTSNLYDMTANFILQIALRRVGAQKSSLCSRMVLYEEERRRGGGEDLYDNFAHSEYFTVRELFSVCVCGSVCGYSKMFTEKNILI
jgi:hypothetical protein